MRSFLPLGLVVLIVGCADTGSTQYATRSEVEESFRKVRQDNLKLAEGNQQLFENDKKIANRVEALEKIVLPSGAMASRNDPAAYSYQRVRFVDDSPVVCSPTYTTRDQAPSSRQRPAQAPLPCAGTTSQGSVADNGWKVGLFEKEFRAHVEAEIGQARVERQGLRTDVDGLRDDLEKHKDATKADIERLNERIDSLDGQDTNPKPKPTPSPKGQVEEPIDGTITASYRYTKNRR